ncbi:MAG: PD-(D/E)XK nuclease family protein [Oligoflexia bacterium]|nr:PD-(D/E)XK nuclease family protein [Oligoflexia bacterium]
MSLSIILYKQQSDLNNLNFLESLENKTSIVCPNPQVADTVGSLKAVSENESITSMTVSKFASEMLKVTSEESPKQNRKSQIYLELGAVFKSKFAHLSENYFEQAFTILTEFRGYTTNIELIDEVLEEVDEELVQIVKLFWAYMEVRPLIDEHKSLTLITDFLRDGEHEFVDEIPREENIIFWGFSHISSAQVDYIKALSIFNNVYIPFYKDLFEKASLVDWIKWLESGNAEIVDLETEYIESKSFNFINFSKGRLSEAIKNLSPEWQESEKVLLGQRNPTVGQYFEIPLSNFAFKVEQDLISEKLSLIRDELEQKITVSDSDSISVDEMFHFLKELKSESVSKSDFRMVKAIELFENSFSQWEDLSDYIEDVTFFDLKVLIEVSTLNSPRNYLMPLINKEKSKQIIGLKEIGSVSEDDKTLFVVTSEYDKVKAGAKVYSDDSLKILATIGPIRNPEMEFQIVSNQIKEIWNSAKTLVLMEKGLLDSSLEWSSVVDKFENSEEKELTIDRSNKSGADVLQKLVPENFKEIKKLSASRLQSFIDCPRKYLFNHILKWDFPNIRPEPLEPRILGELEHLVVQYYIEEGASWEKERFEKTCERTLDSYLSENKKSLDEEQYLECLYEIQNHSKNGITQLLKLLDIDKDTEFKFELELQGERNTGRIDCIASGPALGSILIDFKRGASSIPDKNQLKKFRKIQIWYYLNFLKDVSRWKLWGYLCLSDPNESLFFSEEKEVNSFFKEKGFCEEANYEVISETLDEKLSEFNDLFDEQFSNLQKEKEFQAYPVDKDACQYCVVENLCHRGEL